MELTFAVRYGYVVPAVLIFLSACTDVNTLVQNKCHLNNGQCRYEIQVLSECDPTVDILHKPQYDEKGSDFTMEKLLLESRTDHSRRLRSLERRLGDMMHHVDNPPDVSPGGSVVRDNGDNRARTADRHTAHKTSHSEFDGFKKDPQRKENNLLNKVHKQFTKLRDEIKKLNRHLENAEHKLEKTTKKLNQSEADRAAVQSSLSRTERQLEEKTAESERLHDKLKDLNTRLNDTNSELGDVKAELSRLRIENWRTKVERNDCLKRLEDCLREKETLRKALQQALAKYHELNIRHENVSAELNITEDKLLTCYRGKTTQFCGFEDAGICGFEQKVGSDVTDWLRGRKATHTERTGPSRDHTCRNARGHYMYVEASNMTRGSNARLITPHYMGRAQQCVEFYYHMYGEHTGTLSVYTTVPRQDVAPMWRAFGDQGNVWTLARIPIPQGEASKGYQVVFDAVIGTGSAGDIAIDDFRVSDGACFQSAKSDSTTVVNTAASEAPRHKHVTGRGRRTKKRGNKDT